MTQQFSEEEMVQIFERLRVVVQSDFEHINETIVKVLESFLGNVDESNILFSRMAETLIKCGYAIPASTASLGFLTDLSDTIFLGGKDIVAVNAFFEAKTEKDNFDFLRSIVSNLIAIPYFETRKQIVEDSLQAHIEGKYTLSIPALLPLIEGYVSTFRIVSPPDRPNGIREKMKAFVENNQRDDFFIDTYNIGKFVLINYFFEETSFSGVVSPRRRVSYDDFKNRNVIPLPSEIINRHGILHGFDSQYVSKGNSIRTFFMLDFLAFLTS